MQSDLITVTPEQPLLQAHRLFLEEEIHGAPVVDEDGHLRGVISSLDLLRAVEEEHELGASQPMYFRGDLPYSGPDWFQTPEDFQDRLADLTVADAMAREIVSVAPDTPLAEVARLMRAQRIHRVLVVDDDLLVGIVTTFDLLEELAATDEEPRASRSASARRGGRPHA